MSANGSDDEHGNEGPPMLDIVTAATMAEVEFLVTKFPDVVRIINPDVATAVHAKFTKRKIVKRMATLSLLAAIGGLVAGRFFKDRVPPELQERRSKIGLGCVAAGALLTTIIGQSSPFARYVVEEAESTTILRLQD